MPATSTSSKSYSSYISTPPPKQQHQSRSSVCSLYDLLADLDETQLTYLVQEMNNTASQNMAVSQAISAIESENPAYNLSVARANMQPPTMQRTLSKSQRLRLSLQTMFRSPSMRQTRQHGHTEEEYLEPDMNLTPTLRRKSPAYKRISRPCFNLPPGVTVTDLLNLLEAEFLAANHPSRSVSMSTYSPLSLSASSSFSATPSPTASSSSGRIRRYPSTIDMALEAERSACGIEGIGLGMLEPRPMTPGTPRNLKDSAPVTPVFDRRMRGETPPPPPVVLEGIFEILENK